jgi:hypothetical protein
VHLKAEHDVIAVGKIQNRSIPQLAVAEENLMPVRTISNIQNGLPRIPNGRNVPIPTQLESIPVRGHLQIEPGCRPDSLKERGQRPVCVSPSQIDQSEGQRRDDSEDHG